MLEKLRKKLKLKKVFNDFLTLLAVKPTDKAITVYNLKRAKRMPDVCKVVQPGCRSTFTAIAMELGISRLRVKKLYKIERRRRYDLAMGQFKYGY